MERVGRWTIEVRDPNHSDPIITESYYDEKEAEKAALHLSKQYRHALVFGFFNPKEGGVLTFNPGPTYGDKALHVPGQTWY